MSHADGVVTAVPTVNQQKFIDLIETTEAILSRHFAFPVSGPEFDETMTRSNEGGHSHWAESQLAVPSCNWWILYKRQLVLKIHQSIHQQTHHSPSFTYAVYNRQALDLLDQIKPFLKSYKRKRANLILEQCIALAPRNDKYTDESLARKTQFKNTVLAIKAN